MRSVLRREIIAAVLIIIFLAAWRFDHYHLDRRVQLIIQWRQQLEKDLDEVGRNGTLGGRPPRPGFPKEAENKSKKL